MAHTPLPWKADSVFVENQPNRFVVHEEKWGGQNIADCGENGKDNAEFIVHACNCYNDLLIACREAQLVIKSQNNGNTLVLLDNAIKKARRNSA